MSFSPDDDSQMVEKFKQIKMTPQKNCSALKNATKLFEGRECEGRTNLHMAFKGINAPAQKCVL